MHSSNSKIITSIASLISFSILIPISISVADEAPEKPEYSTIQRSKLSEADTTPTFQQLSIEVALQSDEGRAIQVPSQDTSNIDASTSSTITDNSSLLESIKKEARLFLGTPYLYGSSPGQTKTVDCSSLTKIIFGRHGVKLHRSSKDQAKQGEYVAQSNLRIGDLVFFKSYSTSKCIGHVGIYIGDNKMIHASDTKGVCYANIKSSYWQRHYVTARRVL